MRARRSLDEIDAWLPGAAGAHLRSGDEQSMRFARYPGVVELAGEIGSGGGVRPVAGGPEPAAVPVPRRARRDGVPPPPRRGGRPPDATATPIAEHACEPERGRTIDRELDLIEQLGFPGYFLVVWDLVEFCRRHDIFCQGRGTAANSAVCYALGITKADAVSLGLLFERFLSPERDGPPDIDIDIESDRREEVIQYVYERYGRHHTAQVANVITYRARSAIRDMAKALGYTTGQQDAFSKQIDRWGGVEATAAQPDCTIPRAGARARPPDRGRSPPPRHPLRRHGHLRPPGDRGVSGRVGRAWSSAACSSGTRTTAPPPAS